jgi:bifunctional non-homologous end joining protein LigD
MSEPRSVTLYCREGTSDKEYQLHLVPAPSGDGFLVNYANGKRGKTLSHDTKTQTPVSYDEAVKIYEKVHKEKTRKGYTEAESGMRYVGTDLESRDSGLTPQLPTAILPSDVARYESDDEWVGQEKFDGENRMIVVEAGTVGGVNRKGLTCPVPAHWDAADVPHANGRTVLCGEDMGGRLVAFDIVELDGRDLRALDFVERHDILDHLGETTGDWLEVAPIAVGTAAKRALLARMVAEEGEGVVYKRAHAAFDAGRSVNAFKHKIQESSTFEVVKVNDQRSVAIVLRDDAGTAVPMGNVTVPANHPVPAVGALVEVEYMYRFEDGALMQPKYKGERTDVDGPVLLSQIMRVKRKSLAA